MRRAEEKKEWEKGRVGEWENDFITPSPPLPVTLSFL
jgi:hypothetical protein